MAGYHARVVQDSISEGARLLTVEARYPRFVHAQMLTHRMFSRNASSNRALPFQSVVTRVLDDPVLPVWWGKKARTMEAPEQLSPEEQQAAERIWLRAMRSATESARLLDELKVHKQITNRLLEPYQWITTIFTGTAWDNFFNLRVHPQAQPEERQIATLILGAVEASTPVERDWHLPYVTDSELNTRTLDQLIPLSVARCARVSYLSHDGTYDPDGDLALYARLTTADPPHSAPLEHVANTALASSDRHYNLTGWMSWRYLVEQLDITLDLYQGVAAA